MENKYNEAKTDGGFLGRRQAIDITQIREIF